MGYALFSRKKNCHAKWGPALRRERLYAASCGVFFIGGIWAHVYTDRVLGWLRAPTGEWMWFSDRLYRAQGTACLFQSVLSVLSDVVYSDARSIVHPIDRLMAVVLTLIAVYLETCILLFGPMGPLRVLMLGLVGAALVCHFRAKFGIVSHDYPRYVRNHTIWHFAIVASMVVPMHLAIHSHET